MKKITTLLLLISLSSFGWVKITTEFLKNVEGFRPTPYECLAGRLTIGYGITDSAIVALGHLSEGQATNYLQAEVLKTGRHIMRLVDVSSLTDNQFAALISIYFNIGAGNFRKSTILKNLRAGKLTSIPYEMSRWNKVTNKKGVTYVCDGLVNRRAKDIELWNTK